MTTTTLLPVDDFQCNGQNATYATARETAVTYTASPAAPGAGQRVSPDYVCWESFFSFDTSQIPDADRIDSVVFSLRGVNAEPVTDFTLEARLHAAFVPSIADWVAGSALSGNTLLATFETTGWIVTGYNDFTSDPAFIANINKTGVTYIFVSSSHHRLATVPTTLDLAQAAARTVVGQEPKLVVNHTPARRLRVITNPLRW